MTERMSSRKPVSVGMTLARQSEEPRTPWGVPEAPLRQRWTFRALDVQGLPLDHPTPMALPLSPVRDRPNRATIPAMPRSMARHTIKVDGRKACISLEPAFWGGLREIAEGRGMSVSEVVSSINSERQYANLSSAVRVFVVRHYQASEKKGAPATRGVQG